jgi:hypothetical protein
MHCTDIVGIFIILVRPIVQNILLNHILQFGYILRLEVGGGMYHDIGIPIECLFGYIYHT